MRATSGLSERIGNFIGSLFMLACLILLSSGVSVVRADEAQGGVTASAPSETAAVGPANPVIIPPKASDVIESAPRAYRPAEPGPGGGIVLNTRGYNYGPDRPTIRPQMTVPAATQPSPTPTEPSPPTE